MKEIATTGADTDILNSLADISAGQYLDRITSMGAFKDLSSLSPFTSRVFKNLCEKYSEKMKAVSSTESELHDWRMRAQKYERAVKTLYGIERCRGYDCGENFAGSIEKIRRAHGVELHVRCRRCGNTC